MAFRIEIASKNNDTRAKTRKEYLEKSGFQGKIKTIEIVDVYTINQDLDNNESEAITKTLTQQVTQQGSSDKPQSPYTFDYAIETGFLPGVTDNIGNTAKESIEDLLKKPVEGGVYSSQITFLKGNLTRKDAKKIAEDLANPLIQRIHIKDYQEFLNDKGMDLVVPKVKIQTKPKADIVEILNADDEELITIGKKGIANKDGTRRGPLAMDLDYMKTIQSHFTKLKRNPTDIELESLAQTWSEHCKHTIFADPIDEIKDGLFRTYIKGATETIRKQKGDKDFCDSLFTDNSGGIIFDEYHIISFKVETHNTPSFLDPFGGSITGIVGVNRDAMGFGLGAKPVINIYGYCFADPKDTRPLYKGKNFTQKMLSPRRILEGVVHGVNVGGNCSGIPTPQGFMFFDERYRGKPLVFVGTAGLIPRKSAGRPSSEKKAQPGDYIVMLGGKVGKDGIHGATFSSEAMDEGSPATAVQIGDPITQKKMSDALVHEARDLALYNSITDNGAGGLSCSVAEMAKESGGCHVYLDKVPLKYPGLEPWETWISESQERMTLAVPKEKWSQFSELMQKRKVEATVIGEFTDSNKCIVEYENNTVMDIDMDFLHDGLPQKHLTTTYTPQKHEDPDIPILEDLTQSLHSMLKRLNITSFEFVSQQYDHEVQGGSVLKPLQGKGRVNADATVTKPLLGSDKGVLLSQGISPGYSDIDTYHMAANAIDTAIRNSVAAGADLEKIALLDNFCWCSSDEPEQLGKLKRAAKACYDYAVSYSTPFISGKDSMFNDFKGYDENCKPVKISVPPTLLISTISVMDDCKKAVSLDAKFEGDLVYVLGETHDELGASEYFAMKGEELTGKRFIGNNVPKVDAEKNKKLYKSLSEAIDKGLVASSQSVHKGGLAAALAKTVIGGRKGLSVSLENLPGTATRNDYALYSESAGRIVVTINPEYKEDFEKLMQDNSYSNIGIITKEDFNVKGLDGERIIQTKTDDLLNKYKSTLKDY